MKCLKWVLGRKKKMSRDEFWLIVFFFVMSYRRNVLVQFYSWGMKGLSFEEFQLFGLLSLVSKTKVRILASLYTPEFLKNRS